jgi:squalene-associated FAD-dependent desaturase
LNAPDVVVIGGGFAGLSAATALAERGACVVVIEARRQLGGRATSYRDPATGERIDNGQHVLAGCYDETLAFLDRIGSSHALHRPASLEIAMVDDAGTRHELRLPPLPSPLHLVAGVLAWRELTWSERLAILRVGPVLRSTSRRAAASSANETVKGWLARHQQPDRLCRLFWEPLALATLNQSIEQASVEPFLAVVGRMLGGGPDASSILLPAVMLDELYAEPARKFLEGRGSRCMTGRRARLLVSGDRIEGVSAGDELIKSPAVIAAVPWHALHELFAPVPQALERAVADAASLSGSPIVTVNVWTNRPVLDELFIGLPGRAFQWVFNKARIVGPEFSHLSLVSSGAESIVALDNDAIVRQALADLAPLLPESERGSIRRVSVVRERRATFSLSPAMPARPGTCTPVHGLFLAGDWIETGLPATIESAVIAGHRAAAAAAAHMRH